VRARYALPIGDASEIHRAIRSARLVQIDDVEDGAYGGLAVKTGWRRRGVRSIVVVPMLYDSEILGAIAVSHREVGAFSSGRVDLLKTFADQAVIAIENVRLFTELQEKNQALTEAHAQMTESLEQQTATGEILRVISSSPTDVQPVFNAIARSAKELFEAEFSTVFRFDGTLLHLAAHCGWSPAGIDALRRELPTAPHRRSAGGRAILNGAVEHIPDVYADAEYALGAVGDFLRSTVAVPMLHDSVAIGTINVNRSEPGPFSERQIELLKTFADQAVIAIENVRLFTELQQKNKALTQAHAQVTESLEQQTATSEILRVISRSPTDLQPVFDSIAASALRLCDAKLCTTFRFDGELIHLVGSRHVSEEGADAYRDAYPSRPGRQGGTHRAILTRAIVHIPDI